MKAKPDKHIEMDELLVKYLAGEADPTERTKTELWIDASEANRKYFEHFNLIWNQSQRLTSQSSADENAAWERFRARVQTEYSAPPKTRYNLQWLKVAAMIIVVAGLAIVGPYFIRQSGNTRTVTHSSPDIHNSQIAFIKKTTSNQVKVDNLPDGSIVMINKYSSLSFAPSFTGNKRYAKLSGEAFFNVKHDPARPFIVETGDLLITVLGTSFNVKSRGDTTEVIVETGVVSVKKQQQIITLKTGEKLTALKLANTFTKTLNTNNLYRSYFDKSVVTQTQTLRPAKSNSANAKPDSVLDLKKHPDLLQKILKDPAKWSQIIKNYRAASDDITVRRAVIKKVLLDIKKEHLPGYDTVRTFRLNDTVLLINDKRQPEAVHQRLKNKYIKEPGYTIYMGGAPKTTRGIYLDTDSL